MRRTRETLHVRRMFPPILHTALGQPRRLSHVTQAWIIGLSEDLWPRHWSRGLRMFSTGVFFGTVIGLAVLSVCLLYSSLAA